MNSFIRWAAGLFCSACISTFVVAEDKYATFNGVKIRYIDRGKGEPIVLLHGAHQIWRAG